MGGVGSRQWERLLSKAMALWRSHKLRAVALEPPHLRRAARDLPADVALPGDGEA